MDIRITNFHHCFHENLPLYFEQDDLHLQTHLLYMNFNIILSSSPRNFKCYIHFRCSFSNFVCGHDANCLIYMSYYPLLFNTILTYSMKQNRSWESNRFSVSQEINHILWKPNFHCRIHNCPPPVPILSQIDPVHTPTSHFLKIHLNIILPSTPRSSKSSLSLKFPHPIPAYTSLLSHTYLNTIIIIIIIIIIEEVYSPPGSTARGPITEIRVY